MGSFQGAKFCLLMLITQGYTQVCLIQRYPHFRGWNRGVLISGVWNRSVLILGVGIEVSSFQGVGIKVSSFQGIGIVQKYLHFRGWNRKVPLYTEVSSFHWVGIKRFHCICINSTACLSGFVAIVASSNGRDHPHPLSFVICRIILFV